MDQNLASLLAEALAGNGGSPLSGPELRRRMIEGLLQGHFGREQDSADGTQSRPDQGTEVERLRRTVGQLRTLVNYVGEVFAACPHCWGTRRDCALCHGTGSPGTQALRPERQADFMVWVKPNLAARGLVMVPAPQSPPTGIPGVATDGTVPGA